MFRLLHASRHPTLPSTTEPTLTLHVPAYGVLYCPKPSLRIERISTSNPHEDHDVAGPSQARPGVGETDDEGTYITHPNELRGELEINIPHDHSHTHQQRSGHSGWNSAGHGSGGKRCKAIRVGYRTIARLNMGPERGWEEDVIFERDIGDMAGSAEGIWLEEGITR
jgi:hypothetical protein